MLFLHRHAISARLFFELFYYRFLYLPDNQLCHCAVKDSICLGRVRDIVVSQGCAITPRASSFQPCALARAYAEKTLEQ